MPFATDMFHEQNARRIARAEAQDPSEPDGLAARLNRRIVGQPGAVEAAVRAVVLGRSGLQDGQGPLASLLLVGPTGVGKTELVRRLAAELRSGPDDLCRVDMSSLAQEHYMASLSGAPPGYAGSKESFSLFDRSKIEADPYTPGIVLFDEIEKAHGAVRRALLHVLDHGVLRLANGQQTISFRNAYVFMTSNLGSADLARGQRGIGGRVMAVADRVGGPPARWLRRRGHATIRRALEAFFEPEFLNRIDEVVAFEPLTRADALAIVHGEIDRLGARARRRGIALRVGADVAELLCDAGFDAVYGARSVRRVVRSRLAAPAAAAMLARPTGCGSLVARVDAAGAVVVEPDDAAAG